MGTVTVDDPEFHGEKNVDSNGRVYLGEEYAGKRVKITIEETKEDSDD